MKVFKHQHWHFISLLVLLLGLTYYVHTDPSIDKGKLFGVPTVSWFWLTIIVPITHQLYVLICWRLELFYTLRIP